MITADQLEAYRRDGAVCLRSMFDSQWVTLLDRGLTRHLEAPTSRARVWDRDQLDRTMLWDSLAWRDVPEYEQFVRESPAAGIAGTLMGSSAVNFFFDAVFIRSPGAQFATPWHQDEPYWSVEGFDTCTIWMPLVPVKAENAVAVVPGSHRWDVVYDHYDFGQLNPDAKDEVDRSDFSATAEQAVPDIDADPAGFGVTRWDMQPGDCVVFNSRVMHGGSGKLPDDTPLRVFTSKWLGDDVRIAFRAEGMDPDFSRIMTEYGLRPGDRPGTDLLPRLWEAPAKPGPGLG